ncbi:MAG: DUF2809 domain-containing protein [Planctomycetota bacterium]|nr:DUF2809 domain-containing protein [Planctomycetaceae bacterium]MDQ3331594.1 DUF2809 domain-containing protein [Planctomycetota bacterium]
MRSSRRNPLVWLGLFGLAACLGISSRRFTADLPPFVSAYAGDTLWATAVFLGLGLLLPTASTRRVAALAMIASLVVEISQLYKARWIDAIRRTKLGGLMLGFDFVWSDLLCYAAGVGLGILIERSVRGTEPS